MPCDNFCVWEVTTKYVECTANCDIHDSVPCSLDTFEIC